jgi:DNA-binding IclR family transcriptional regulator
MLQRGLAVLGAFDAQHPVLTLTEIAARTGFALSTTSRLVGQLQEWGALTRSDTRDYTIGPRVWDLGLLSNVHRQVRVAGLPVLRDVFATTRQNVHLAVRDGSSALFVERLSEARTAGLTSRPGNRIPLYACAVGKAMLAHAPDEVVRDALSDAVALTDRTITDYASLTEELGRVRVNGFAQTVQEFSLVGRSVAAPILDAHGGATAAIGIVAESDAHDLARLAPVLQIAARAIARRLDPRAEYAYSAVGGP